MIGLLRATAPPESSFNADFYLALATVVPLFLLALSVATFRRLGMVTLLRWMGSDQRRRLGALGAFIMTLPAAASLATEITALSALLNRRNAGHVLDVLMLASIALLAALIFGGIFDTIWAEAGRLAGSEPPAPDVPPPDVQAPPTTEGDGESPDADDSGKLGHTEGTKSGPGA